MKSILRPYTLLVGAWTSVQEEKTSHSSSSKSLTKYVSLLGSTDTSPFLRGGFNVHFSLNYVAC